MTPNEPVKVGDTLYLDNGTRNAPLWLAVKVTRITGTFIETEGLAEGTTLQWNLGRSDLRGTSWKERGRADSYYGRYAYRRPMGEDVSAITPAEARTKIEAERAEAQQREQERRGAILAERGLRGLILDALETDRGIASLHLRSVRNSLPESERDDYYNEVERLLGDTFEQLRNMRERVKSYGEQLKSLSERGW